MDAVEQLLPDAYERVSDGGRLWANLRQLMYAMRPEILRMTGLDSFSDGYITQTCIPRFADPSWKLAADARGAMIEPHTQARVGVGTIEVADYTTSGIPLRIDRPVASHRLITGLEPVKRMRRVLFVEKEGFGEAISSSGILERHDMGLVSTKGMNVIAVRQLIDYLIGEDPEFEIFALLDFDKSGVSNLASLTRDTKRFTFTNDVVVTPIGVTWGQAQMLHKRGLSEPVPRKEVGTVSALMEAGLDFEPAQFLAGDNPRRVEINAFTTQELLDLIETSVSGGKRIPDAEALETAWAEMAVRAKVAAYEAELRKQPLSRPIGNLQAEVKALLDQRPELAWDEAVAVLAAAAVE